MSVISCSLSLPGGGVCILSTLFEFLKPGRYGLVHDGGTVIVRGEGGAGPTILELHNVPDDKVFQARTLTSRLIENGSWRKIEGDDTECTIEIL